eukprot:TRINITY_DN2512_c0_g1_i2.p1 TRINITY_DN2512_c0_g1~~TRINITY_DN2512_c0_g1_i2.p1  ORF type:complete len:234 (-),score=53.52 TRINITY_DN2512_c0_g1_i2:61-705(-)
MSVCSRKPQRLSRFDAGRLFLFKTQGWEESIVQTPGCVVRYKEVTSLGSSLRVSCSKFSVKNKKSSCTKKGDRMVVVAEGKAKRFCQSNPPNITTSEDLKVVFLSNKGGQSYGAECLVQCQEASHTTGQKEGESCGSCFCPPSFTAGECEAGLTCIKDAMIPDLPGTCQKIAKKEGESCGSCMCPPTFTAGDCEEGLTCVFEPGIADAPGVCTK